MPACPDRGTNSPGCDLINPDLSPTQCLIHDMLCALSSGSADSSNNYLSDDLSMEERLKIVSFNCLSGIRLAAQSRLELEPDEYQLLRLSIRHASASMLTKPQTLAAACDAQREPDVKNGLILSRRAAGVIARVICTSKVWSFGEAETKQVADTVVEWYQATVSESEASAP